MTQKLEFFIGAYLGKSASSELWLDGVMVADTGVSELMDESD
jgi:hypothetical protein